MRSILVFLVCAISSFAWTDVAVPNTYSSGGIIYASQLNENNDTLEAGINNLADTVDIKFIRFADLSSGDSTLSRLQVDTIRSNPTIDSVVISTIANVTGKITVDTIQSLDILAGNPTIDSVVVSSLVSITGRLQVDTIRSNPDVDSVKGYPFIDSVATGFANVTKMYVDSIRSNADCDSLSNVLILGSKAASNMTIGSSTGSIFLYNTTDGANGVRIPNMQAGSSIPGSRFVIVEDNTYGRQGQLNYVAAEIVRDSLAVVGGRGTGVAGKVAYWTSTEAISDTTRITLTKLTTDSISGSPTINAVTVTGTAAVDSLASTKGITCTQINTGQGLTEVYGMDQGVKTTDAPTFATVNTGQGAYELYSMNQNVTSTSSVQFAKMATDTLVVTVDSISIASNAVAAVGSYVIMDTEGDAATDTLATLGGTTQGRVIIIQSENSARDIFIDSGADNIALGGDRTLDNAYDSITLIYFTGLGWREVSFYDGGS